MCSDQISKVQILGITNSEESLLFNKQNSWKLYLKNVNHKMQLEKLNAWGNALVLADKQVFKSPLFIITHKNTGQFYSHLIKPIFLGDNKHKYLQSGSGNELSNKMH